MENINEKNLLIAEFMGAEIKTKTVQSIEETWVYFTKNPTNKDWSKLPLGRLQYHTSWDWLMPVVEKIRNTSKGSSVRQAEKIDHVLHSLMLCDIKHTYPCVIKFITWYNKQPQQTASNKNDWKFTDPY